MKIKFTDKPKETLYIYCRVSTSNQSDDGVSLDVQEKRGTQLSKKLNLSPIIIKEQGSGMKPFTETRPQFTELFDGITDGRVKNVWIDEETRLTRYDMDLQFIHLEMKKNEVNLYVGNNKEPKKWDFITDLVDTIITKVNQHQIRTQVKKSIRSKVKLFNEGCYMKGDPPFGYKLVDKKLEIDEEKSKWVKKIFDWYDDGKSTHWIRNELFVNGIKPPRQKGDWFPLRTITIILTNKNYIGDDIYHDKSTEITHKNKCPVIIDKEIFTSIQKKITHNKGQYIKRRRDYLLRGIIKCSDGTPMNCKGITKTQKYELYVCNHSVRKHLKRKTNDCSIVKSLRQTEMNEYVWDMMCNTLSMSHNYREEIKQEIMGNKPQYSKRSYNLKIKKLNKELMDLDDRKMDLEKRFYSGDMIQKKYNILMDTIENKENDIIKNIEKNRFQLQSMEEKSKWVSWLDVHFSRIDELSEVNTYEERRKIISKYIQEIIVLDYNEDTKQHSIVIKFKLPLFNDKFVWKLNKDGSHKTDKWGRWIYEIMDGEKSPTNPFTYRKSLNGNRFC